MQIWSIYLLLYAVIAISEKKKVNGRKVFKFRSPNQLKKQGIHVQTTGNSPFTVAILRNHSLKSLHQEGKCCAYTLDSMLLAPWSNC